MNDKTKTPEALPAELQLFVEADDVRKLIEGHVVNVEASIHAAIPIGDAGAQIRAPLKIRIKLTPKGWGPKGGLDHVFNANESVEVKEKMKGAD